ncbi:MAG: DNA polymerase III subunit delta [Pseudoxanthomonas sp.]
MEMPPERMAALPDDGTLHPVYLIAGPEMLRVQEAADAVRRQARAQGISEREVFDADGRDFDWGTLQATFNAPSLFSPRRLVEVRLPTGKPGKDGAQTLSFFCANPPPDVILLVTAGDWSKAHQGKWTEAIARIGVVSIAWAIKPHELAGWVESRLRMKGLRVDRDATQILVERVEGNLLAAAQEIDKLVLLAQGETLDAESMQSLVADAARYDVFRLTDAVLDGQAAHVSRMLAGLRAEGDAVAGLMPMVIRELLRTAALARAQAQAQARGAKPGSSPGQALSAEMKSQGIWEARQAPFKRTLQRHPNPARWDRFVAEASRVDRIAKGRADGDAWVAMERLLLAIAEARAVRLLVA